MTHPYDDSYRYEAVEAFRTYVDQTGADVIISALAATALCRIFTSGSVAGMALDEVGLNIRGDSIHFRISADSPPNRVSIDEALPFLHQVDEQA